MKSTKTKSKRVAAGPGVPCPRCGQASIKYIHPPNFRPEPSRAWYDHWFICHNGDCTTNIFFDCDPTYPPKDELDQQLDVTLAADDEHDRRWPNSAASGSAADASGPW